MNDWAAKKVHRSEEWHSEQSMDSAEQWAARLLRAERARTIRLVEQLKSECPNPCICCCDTLLKKLAPNP